MADLHSILNNYIRDIRDTPKKNKTLYEGSGMLPGDFTGEDTRSDEEKAIDAQYQAERARRLGDRVVDRAVQARDAIVDKAEQFRDAANDAVDRVRSYDPRTIGEKIEDYIYDKKYDLEKYDLENPNAKYYALGAIPAAFAAGAGALALRRKLSKNKNN